MPYAFGTHHTDTVRGTALMNTGRESAVRLMSYALCLMPYALMPYALSAHHAGEQAFLLVAVDLALHRVRLACAYVSRRQHTSAYALHRVRLACASPT